MPLPVITSLNPSSGARLTSFDIVGTGLTNIPSLTIDPNISLAFDGDYTDTGSDGITTTGSGTPTFSAGKINKGIDLNGSSQYAETNLTYNSIIGGSGHGPFTIASWFKTGTFAADQTICFAGDHNATNNKFKIFVDTSSNLSAMHRGNTISDPTVLLINTWYHALITVEYLTLSDSLQMKIYLNNNSIVSQGIGFGSYGTYSGANLMIGVQDNDNTTPTDYWNGSLDAFYYFNRVITSGERAAIYAEPSLAVPTVKFNGSAVTPTTYSSTLIGGITVPDLSIGAYPVTVETTEGTSVSSDFTIAGSGRTYTIDVNVSDFTLMFWIKEMSATEEVLFEIGTAPIEIKASESGGDTTIKLDSDSLVLSSIDFTGSTWINVALAYDHSGTSTEVFVDGVTKGSISKTISASGTTMQMGKIQTWKGFDVRMYSKLLTASDLLYYIDDINNNSGDIVMDSF